MISSLQHVVFFSGMAWYGIVSYGSEPYSKLVLGARWGSAVYTQTIWTRDALTGGAHKALLEEALGFTKRGYKEH